MRSSGHIGMMLAAASLGISVAVPAAPDTGRRRFPRSRATSVNSAAINRHTGMPHEHKREIARNLRRAGK
jgi:hypothetical protein